LPPFWQRFSSRATGEPAVCPSVRAKQGIAGDANGFSNSRVGWHSPVGNVKFCGWLTPYRRVPSRPQGPIARSASFTLWHRGASRGTCGRRLGSLREKPARRPQADLPASGDLALGCGAPISYRSVWRSRGCRWDILSERCPARKNCLIGWLVGLTYRFRRGARSWSFRTDRMWLAASAALSVVLSTSWMM